MYGAEVWVCDNIPDPKLHKKYYSKRIGGGGMPCDGLAYKYAIQRYREELEDDGD